MSQELVPASQLVSILNDVAAGHYNMTGQHSQISQECLGWVLEHPELRVSYDRFERARQRVRRDSSTDAWQELKDSATAHAAVMQELVVAV